MGFIHCPNCSKAVSDQAQISACPNCCHPFRRTEWQKKTAEMETESRKAAERRKIEMKAAEQKHRDEEYKRKQADEASWRDFQESQKLGGNFSL